MKTISEARDLLKVYMIMYRNIAYQDSQEFEKSELFKLTKKVLDNLSSLAEPEEMIEDNIACKE